MLETDRLILRPMNARDVNAIFAMRSDIDVMRFIREPQSRDESANWIKLVSSRWKREEIGFCAMLEKLSQEFVGWCGIWQLQETGELEIGYAVAKQFWGRGFATEAALRFLDYAFENLGNEKTVAVTRPENAASRRVMEKIGMRYDYTGEFYGFELVHYSIDREKWKLRNEQNF